MNKAELDLIAEIRQSYWEAVQALLEARWNLKANYDPDLSERHLLCQKLAEDTLDAVTNTIRPVLTYLSSNSELTFEAWFRDASFDYYEGVYCKEHNC